MKLTWSLFVALKRRYERGRSFPVITNIIYAFSRAQNDDLDSLFVSRSVGFRVLVNAKCVIIQLGVCNWQCIHFRPVTEDFVRRTIVSSPLKTCELDAFPTPLLLECLDSLLPCITDVFNNSLFLFLLFFPSVYKSARVKPHLKKMSLDPDDLKNYRPVSNLSFLSKVLERIVLSQLNEHLNHSNLLSPLQSAYRPNHSTETALLRIV